MKSGKIAVNTQWEGFHPQRAETYAAERSERAGPGYIGGLHITGDGGGWLISGKVFGKGEHMRLRSQGEQARIPED